ncbi:transporter [Eubacteriales bacterium OttesenSCG-928-M02]|nr:transporter [Eubacteriales bacterium OttesenSCG-928-M02]
MDLLLAIARGASTGIVVGFFIALFRKKARRGKEDAAGEARRLRMQKWLSGYLSYFTFMGLLVGLVWTGYYMVLGLMDPLQAEYATNVSQLIVSFLTIYSIIIAFLSFLRER